MMIGFIGTILHVASWLLALVFDIVASTMIHPEHSPTSYAFWLWGLITLLVALVVLAVVTIWHMLTPNADNKIPEGGAPPFLMTLMIGGAQISLILTILNLVPGHHDGWLAYDGTGENASGLTGDDKDKKFGEFRTMLILSVIFKVYCVQFLRNNQEWAGPAKAYKANL